MMRVSYANIFFKLKINLLLKEIFFELASAFGTTGLSLGITGDLTIVGKLVLIIIMFIGRVGVLALLLMFKGNRQPSSIKYPEIDMIVG